MWLKRLVSLAVLNTPAGPRDCPRPMDIIKSATCTSSIDYSTGPNRRVLNTVLLARLSARRQFGMKLLGGGRGGGRKRRAAAQIYFSRQSLQTGRQVNSSNTWRGFCNAQMQLTVGRTNVRKGVLVVRRGGVTVLLARLSARRQFAVLLLDVVVATAVVGPPYPREMRAPSRLGSALRSFANDPTMSYQ